MRNVYILLLLRLLRLEKLVNVKSFHRQLEEHFRVCLSFYRASKC